MIAIINNVRATYPMSKYLNIVLITEFILVVDFGDILDLLLKKFNNMI